MDAHDLLHNLSDRAFLKSAGAEFLAELKKTAAIKCKSCEKPAVHALFWCENRAYVPSCDGCLEKTKKMDCFKVDGVEAVRPIQYIIDKKKQRKTASVLGVAQVAMDSIAPHVPTLAAGLVGGAAASGLQYLANKKRKNGKPSAQQEIAKNLSDKTKDSKNFSGQVAHASSKAVKEIADIFAKHPVKGALMAFPVGAAGGASIARLLKK